MIYTVTLNPALDKTVTISGFSPGKVNHIEQMRQDPGGKGINISKVLNGLGAHSVATGILGGDTGRYIRQYLEKTSIEHDFIYVTAPTRTNLKILDPKEHTNTDINEPGYPVDQKTVDRVLAKLTAGVVSGDTVVLAGSVPPGIPDDLYAVWTERLHSLGALVYLDADGPLLMQGVKAKPDLIKPNEDEFAGLIGKRCASLSELAEAAIELHRQGVARVVVSLGGQGALFVRDGRARYAKALEVPVKSTVGSGDATMAALILGNEHKSGWMATIQSAIAAGAASVMCEGTEAVSPDTVSLLQKQVIVEEILL